MQAVQLKIPGFSTILGEGLIWDEGSGRVWMTDILGKRLLSLDLEELSYVEWKFSQYVCWVLPTEQSHQYLLGLERGVAIFDRRDPGCLQFASDAFPSTEHVRLNDACVDCYGNVWLGSMSKHYEGVDEGELALLTASGQITVCDSGFGITNGPIVSIDGDTLFLNDSAKKIMYEYPIRGGALAGEKRKEFLAFDDSMGLPDGMCFDSDGYIWVAMWGGGEVVRLNRSGGIDKRCTVPAENVTNVCFAGSNLERLLVSTAQAAPQLRGDLKNSGAGQVFEILDHNCRGVAQRAAGIKL